jgi:hypothetical protein
MYKSSSFSPKLPPMHPDSVSTFQRMPNAAAAAARAANPTWVQQQVQARLQSDSPAASTPGAASRDASPGPSSPVLSNTSAAPSAASQPPSQLLAWEQRILEHASGSLGGASAADESARAATPARSDASNLAYEAMALMERRGAAPRDDDPTLAAARWPGTVRDQSPALAALSVDSGY